MSENVKKETPKEPPTGEKKMAKIETRGRKKLINVKVLFGSIYSKGRYYEQDEVLQMKEEDIPLLIEQGLVARVD